MRAHAPVVLLLVGLLTACDAGGSAPAPTQPPADYLSTALDWIAAHAVRAAEVDWPAVRQEAAALAPAPRSAAETYPAIKVALGRLGDYAFLMSPEDLANQPGAGVGALYPDGLIFAVDKGSRAEAAGVRPGDVLTQVNGRSLEPWGGSAPRLLHSWGVGVGRALTYTLSVRAAGTGQPREVSVPAAPISQAGAPGVRRLGGPGAPLGYIDLPADQGTPGYPAVVQQGMREADSAAVCGWIVDLRRNTGGDLWTLLAAVGPILGDGTGGGFLYADGKRDTWAYRDGKVFWNADERAEDIVDGGVYHPKRAMPPVALLTSRVTQAAGELVAVAFHGRPGARSFGEPTSGAAILQDHTALSDGAELFVSGAYGLDRAGAVYKGAVEPDQPVAVNWAQLGADTDPGIIAARAWLQAQPGCAP